MAAATLFDPKSDVPFALSRSKVELFPGCPRCFHLDRLQPCDGNDGWVEGTLRAIRDTLAAPQPPASPVTQ